MTNRSESSQLFLDFEILGWKLQIFLGLNPSYKAFYTIIHHLWITPGCISHVSSSWKPKLIPYFPPFFQPTTHLKKEWKLLISWFKAPRGNSLFSSLMFQTWANFLISIILDLKHEKIFADLFPFKNFSGYM